jgi:hypothetical protein
LKNLDCYGLTKIPEGSEKSAIQIHTVFVNMLTNVLKVCVNENIKRRRRKLCLLMLFDRIL